MEYWHRDQNALVIDNQERIVRVVLFVLTLLKETRSPFLVLTTQNALSIWEAEFSRWGSCARIVVYKGCRNVRSMIRTLEFYNKKGNIMFQVFLSCYADVGEDIETFRDINWEVIILDECQHPNMLTHFDQIKLLASNMRLLLVRSQIKDWNFNYHNVLCLLDPQYEGTQKDNLDVHPSSNSSKLKERLLYFTAYDYQSEKIKFVEFWVPAMLTNVQTEQYCASLFSKSMLLCSSLKGDSTGSLHDILLSTRKCCDHPFLVDWSLRSVVLKGIPTADHFDVEIQLSGKLQLLNKILSEIERRGLRVVILFQLLGASGTISVGDILDDFIYQKFGEDRYIRIDGNISRPTKVAACDMFNIKDSEKFICLIETRACTPSIKLSSIDAIIIFNSDWDPLNDIKALKRITIDSKFDEMNVFRLYSSCTVEEKVLILAKEGVILDIKIKDMKPSICHKLLSWGASYLFRKLDASNEFMASSLEIVNTAEQTLLEDVVQELLHLLPRRSGDHNYVECSMAKPSSMYVLKVQQNEGTYCGVFSLHGELIVQSKDNFSIVRHLIDTEPPHIFWTNLLEDKQPRWKYMSSPMQRIKRKVKYLDDLLYETENEVPKKKANTEANARDNQPPKSAFITKKTRSSATKRYTCLVKPSTCAPQTRGSARDYDRNVQRHCETLNLPTLTASTNNNNSGRESDSSAEKCSTPDQLPLSSYSMPIGNCAVDVSISGGIQNGHTNSTKDGSLPGAAGLGNKNAVDHSGYHLTETSLSTNSPSLKKLMDNMQEGKEKAVVLHNDLKLCLESERKKEIEEVNKKYDKLILNAENAIAKTKSELETCYIKVHEHKLLAEAILQLQKLDQISAAERVKWGGLSPEESQTHRVTNLTAASRCHASPEQDLLDLRSTNPAAMTSIQVVLQSSEGPQSGIKASAGEAQSSADLEINRSAKTSCEPMHTSPPRVPSVRSNSTSRSINSGRQLRAPAPHLRHARPPPAFSALNSNPSAI